ncbi:MAG: helix-turn-helix transcriptional regulator [Planctomycetia bacterium]|nr:helix-turn-helix transcriptional regulator [Planctomycetia bacterium]
MTPEQRATIAELRQQIETEEKDELIAIGKRLRAAKRRGIAALNESLQLLRAEREAQGLSLSDLEQRTGIAESNLSKLENAEDDNPNLTTLATYAEALGKKLVISLSDASIQ